MQLLHETGKSTFVGQQESLACVYVWSGSKGISHEYKELSVHHRRAFEIQHQITVACRHKTPSIVPLSARNKATAHVEQRTFSAAMCTCLPLLRMRARSCTKGAQKLKNAWGPRSVCSGGGASQTPRDNCWRLRFIVFAPRFIATSRRFK